MEQRPTQRHGKSVSQWRSLFVATAGGYLLASALLLTAGGLLVNMSFASGLRAWDRDVTRWLVEHRSGTLDDLTEVVSRSADTFGIVFTALLVELVLWVFDRRDEMLVLAVGLFLELSVFLSVNHLVDRPRPDVEPLGSVPSTFSFPSGHTAAAAVLWMSVALLAGGRLGRGADRPVLQQVLAVVAVVITALVAVARVYRGMHHATDVVAGALLGTVCFLIAVAVHRIATAPTRSPAVEPRSLEAMEVAR